MKPPIDPRSGCTTERNNRSPPDSAEPPSRCEGPLRGIFTHTPCRQPPAADSRFRPFGYHPISRSARPVAASARRPVKQTGVQQIVVMPKLAKDSLIKKRARMRRLLLLVIIATCIGNGPTLAGTLVEFPNLPGRQPVHLIGYLARPGAGLSAPSTRHPEMPRPIRPSSCCMAAAASPATRRRSPIGSEGGDTWP